RGRDARVCAREQQRRRRAPHLVPRREHQARDDVLTIIGRRAATVVAAVVGVLGRASSAGAAVPLCLEVSAPPTEREGFEKLVRSEIARHKSHEIAPAGCRAHLRVELFEAAGTRYLTAQIDTEVPARFVIHDASELTVRVEDAVRLTLWND